MNDQSQEQRITARHFALRVGSIAMAVFGVAWWMTVQVLAVALILGSSDGWAVFVALTGSAIGPLPLFVAAWMFYRSFPRGTPNAEITHEDAGAGTEMSVAPGDVIVILPRWSEGTSGPIVLWGASSALADGTGRAGLAWIASRLRDELRRAAPRSRGARGRR